MSLKNEAVIRDFVKAWSRLNPEEIAGYFTEEGVYHNMPAGPVHGRERIRAFIAGFIKDWTATEWDLLTMVSSGDVVVAERLDRTRSKKGEVDLPCCGVFEMRNGKIAVWRDYFDLATYTRATS
ncbi:MAG: nuclear transport factor 2 family protein [Hyphomonadaceae bacterium]|nr:nuclear transport factor 2 family protein [Hyphomonadaceae bacterium]